jgi:glycosyltransferase involved in cell wall biosynthesis
MRSAGIVAIGSTDQAYVWSGGHYYLQHLVKCVAALPAGEALPLHDVWWMTPPQVDPFQEVRSLLGAPVVVAPPASLAGRVARRVRRFGTGSRDARDLFDAAAIDVFFPAPPCENAGTPYVFWIPDFQHTRRPDLMSETVRDRFTADIARLVPRAARVVLSSYDAQKDFGAQFPQLLDRTHVVRFCSVPDAEWWRHDPLAVAQRHGLPERFLIVCNQWTRHKNHLVLLDAMRLLADRGREDIHLVCTGSTFDYREEDYVGQAKAFLAQHGLESRVSILGLIPRADQIALLRRAVAVAQPSMFEGWSTIVEDAKTLGKPIFVSELPVHREQLGGGQAYLDPGAPQQWADAIGSAWAGLQPGPNALEEKLGGERMETARRACGLAFVGALKAAAPDDAR